jgi:hypothetical protein
MTSVLFSRCSERKSGFCTFDSYEDGKDQIEELLNATSNFEGEDTLPGTAAEPDSQCVPIKQVSQFWA